MAIARSAAKTSARPTPTTNGSGTPPPAAGPDVRSRNNEPPDPPEVVAGAAAETVAWWVVLVSIAGVALTYAVVYWASRNRWDPDPLEAIIPLQGLGPFALFYVAAQALERLLEPFSKLSGTKARLVSELQTAAAKFATSAVANTGGTGPVKSKQELGELAAQAQAALNAERANRTVYLWAAATALGIIASGWLNLYFLHAVGMTAAPRSAELLATGLIIGAGTKPLHDLISRLEKAKTKATDPAETGGN